MLIKSIGLPLALGLAGLGASVGASVPMVYEEAFARDEERRILQVPIADIQNILWFDYRINVTEAQKDLASDLGRATDLEDRRDAWEEYGTERRKERVHYVKKMAKRGYRAGAVNIED